MSAFDITILLFAGLVSGFSKFSIGGMGLLVLPIIMIVLPGPDALGVLIPVYIIIDFLAISSYRKNIAWQVLFRLLPLAFIGVLIGGKLLANIDPGQYVYVLSTIMVGMILLSVYLEVRPASFMRHPIAAYTIGLVSGFISLIANATGPLVSLFLMEQNLSKRAYVSTRAWAFLVINLSKLPVLFSLGFVDKSTLPISLMCLPGVIVGAFLGAYLIKRINLKQFKWLIRGMAVLAAIKLFIFS